MKKPAAKSTAAKTPAPATKAVSSTKSTAKKVAVPVKKAAAPAPAPVAPEPAPKPAPKPAAKSAVKAKASPVPPAPKAPSKAPSPKPQSRSAAVTTTIVAAVDVGFGNSLTLRGEGPGLSWEAGMPLECSADDRWSITLPETSQPIICKFLLNDTTWCAGEDYTVLPGSSVVLSPTF